MSDFQLVRIAPVKSECCGSEDGRWARHVGEIVRVRPTRETGHVECGGQEYELHPDDYSLVEVLPFVLIVVLCEHQIEAD